MKHSHEDIEREAYQIYLKKLRRGISEGCMNNALRNWYEAEEKLKLEVVHE